MKALMQESAPPQPRPRYAPAVGQRLRDELRAAGCFAAAPSWQSIHMAGVIAVYGSAYGVLLTQPGIALRGLALAALAFSSVQAGYIAHEAGHGAITRRRWLKLAIGQFFNTFLTALSYSHFQKIHTCHHSHCNDQDRDVDMQSALFSLYPDAKGNKSTPAGRLVTRYQAWLIWPLVSLQGFTLKLDSLATLRRNPRQTRTDALLLILHLLLWSGPPAYCLGLADAALNYFFMTWMIGPYLGSVFLVNHIGTHVVMADERSAPFLQRLMTTRNLGNSAFENFYFGGLNNHIEHHLFPSIPSARLPRARRIVRAFCERHALPYRAMSWREAAAEVFAYLDRIARQPVPPLARHSARADK